MKRNSRSIALAALVALTAASTISKMAEAAIINGNGCINHDLSVVYNSGAIDFGPLSFGLTTLPDTVQASFGLGPGQQGSDPSIVEFTAAISANISFGDATWIQNELNNFFVEVQRYGHGTDL